MDDLWKAGDIAKVRKGWFMEGTEFKVLGPPIYVEQWWLPVVDPDDGDPVFFKEGGFIKVKEATNGN